MHMSVSCQSGIEEMMANSLGLLVLLLLPVELAFSQTVTDSKHAIACYFDSTFRSDTLQCQQNYIIQIKDIEVAYLNDCLGISTSQLCPWHLIGSDTAYYQHVESTCHGRNRCLLESNDVRNETFKQEFHQCGTASLQDRNSVKVEYFCKGSPQPSTMVSMVTTAEGDANAVTSTGGNITILLTHSTITNSSVGLSTSYISSSISSTIEIQQAYGSEKRSSTISLTTILGIVGGAVIVLALVCLVIFILVRNNRRKNSTDSTEPPNEFTYYSSNTVTQGTTMQARPYSKQCPIVSIDSALQREDNTEHYYSIPDALKESEPENVYTEVEDPTRSPPMQPTNNIYSECEIVPPCPCCTGDRLYDQPVSMIDNDFYSVSTDGAKTDTSKLI